LLSALAGALLALACMTAAAHAEIFTSLEGPPTRADIEQATARGVTFFDFDLDADGATEAIAAIKAANGHITAYHIGGGGGRAWGSVKAGERVRRYDSPRDFLALTEDVKRLVGLGADAIHFDNTHRFSGRRLEAIADAIVAGGAGFVAKNNAGKWSLVMRRRPDLRPVYAVIENAMYDADETQAAADIARRGIPVYIVGFRQPLDKHTPAVTDEHARAYAAANSWARVLLMDDERAYDSRTGVFVK
jgi:hypothetical protein